MDIETNDSTAQMRMTRAEYTERCANLERRQHVNLVSCRMALRILLDTLAQGRTPSVETIETAQAACVAAERDAEETHALVFEVEITDGTPATFDQIEMPLESAE